MGTTIFWYGNSPDIWPSSRGRPKPTGTQRQLQTILENCWCNYWLHVGFTHEFPPEFLVARDRPSHRFEREYKVDTANAVYGEMTSDPSPQFWKSWY